MGGDTGGNDCVHVEDFGRMGPLDRQERGLRSDTEVAIRDEHGNVCQFTYQGWDAFRLRMADGTFDHIGDRPRPEDIVPIAGARDTLIFPVEANTTYVASATVTRDAGLWERRPGGHGCDTCRSDDGCAECRAPSDPDPFDQPRVGTSRGPYELGWSTVRSDVPEGGA